jgi:hypothetical protein
MPCSDSQRCAVVNLAVHQSIRLAMPHQPSASDAIDRAQDRRGWVWDCYWGWGSFQSRADHVTTWEKNRGQPVRETAPSGEHGFV